MLTLNEIKNISFRKARSGYKPEDVDEFIDQVVESYDLLIKKNIEQKETNEKLAAENERLQNSIKSLSEEKKAAPAPAPAAKPAAPAKVRPEDVKLSEECEYTQEEIKNALLSAQKLANATIREARQKAEGVLTDANTKAERIVSAAQGEVNEQKEELDRLKKLVSDFRASLLDAYKEHLKLVNAMPTIQRIENTPEQKPAAKPAAPAAAPATPAPAAKPAAPAAAPAPKKEEPAAKPAEAPKAPEQKPEPKKEEKPAETPAKPAAEEMSQTKSFQLGKHKNDTGEFSELKFGADYDITKE